MVVLGGRLQLQSDYIPERRTLRLTVVRGVALNAPLPASDTPISPYILIQLRPHNVSSNDHVQTPEEMRTRVIEMTNAPEFNHTCEYLIGSSLQTRKWRLHIEAWDSYQFPKEQFLGCFSFALQELTPPYGPPIGWYHLLDRDQGNSENIPAFTMSAEDLSSSDLSLSRRSSDALTQSIRWADLLPANTIKDLRIEERRRQEVIYELISTEQSYLDDLNLIMRVYDRTAFASTLKPAEHSFLIGQFEPLRSLSLALLDDLVARQQSDSMIVGAVGDILQRHIPNFLKAYATFCDSNIEAERFVYTKMKEDETFARICAQCRTQCRNMDVSSFRLKPMQRVTRYPLLVKAILQYTPEFSPDYISLVGALSDCQTIVIELNERLRSADLKRQFDQLCASLVVPDKLKPFEVASPDRVLLKIGSMHRLKVSKVRSSSGSHRISDSKLLSDLSTNQPLNLYLFADQSVGPFLLLTQLSDVETLKLPPLPLTAVDITPLTSDSSSSSSNSTGSSPQPTTDMMISYMDPSQRQVDLVLRADSATICTHWVTSLLAEQRTALSLPVISRESIEEVVGYANELRLKVALTAIERKLLKAASMVEALAHQNAVIATQSLTPQRNRSRLASNNETPGGTSSHPPSPTMMRSPLKTTTSVSPVSVIPFRRYSVQSDAAESVAGSHNSIDTVGSTTSEPQFHPRLGSFSRPKYEESPQQLYPRSQSMSLAERPVHLRSHSGSRPLRRETSLQSSDPSSPRESLLSPPSTNPMNSIFTSRESSVTSRRLPARTESVTSNSSVSTIGQTPHASTQHNHSRDSNTSISEELIRVGTTYSVNTVV